jgi:hypothetical protein
MVNRTAAGLLVTDPIDRARTRALAPRKPVARKPASPLLSLEISYEALTRPTLTAIRNDLAASARRATRDRRHGLASALTQAVNDIDRHLRGR